MDHRQTLLSPIAIGKRTCPNRFFIQAMECTDADADGNPSDLTYQRYEDLFRGEAGLVSLEAISVTDESLARRDQLIIMPRNAKPLANFVAKMKAVNPKTLFIFQLTHSGEFSGRDFSRVVAVKPLPGQTADILTEEELEQIMAQFVLAAQIAHDAGADGIDLKLCHGYLGSQVLRPYNDRQWKYGGSWENRRQFAFDLLERIKVAVNDDSFLLGSKISAWEGFPGGCGTAAPDSPIVDLTETIDLLQGLEARGAHYIIQSAGSGITGTVLQARKQQPHFIYLHQTFAKVFRDNLKPETVVIGSGYSPLRDGKNELRGASREDTSLFVQGARNIDRGYVDMIGLGRQSLADPLLPLKLREGRESEITYCTVCDNCGKLLGNHAPVGCSTYNRFYTEKLVELLRPKSAAR
jgi:2,4-dienoyl-CoA reductase-like NADH-dependent reductase (Old Yellow Enzyme family)